MAGVNKVILLGNLGKDPEVRHLENGNVVANFTLATSENYKNKAGERVDMTEWHEIEMWDGLAKTAEKYLTKGSSIYMEGRIKTQLWQDNEGKNRKTVRIRATSMTMLPKKDGGGNNTNSSSVEPNAFDQSTGEVFVTEGGDDLPF